MRRILMVTSLAIVMIWGATAFAASNPNEIKFGIFAPLNSGPFQQVAAIGHADTYPVLCNMEINKQYEVQAGFGNIGQGEKQDSWNRFLIQGSWYLFKNLSLKFGPMAGFYTLALGQKASDNTVNMFYLGMSARKNIWENIDLKLDVIGLSLVSGKAAGNDIKDANQLLPGLHVGLTFNII